MNESNLLRIVQAFEVSQVMYFAPYLWQQRVELIKIYALLRRAYKQAIGLPTSTSTKQFTVLDFTNSLNELIGAQQLGQRDWLGTSHPHSAPTSFRNSVNVKNLYISQLLRNMHPIRNKEQREAKAHAVQKRCESRERCLHRRG